MNCHRNQAPLLDMVGDWRTFLAGGLNEAEQEALRRHERTGRPLGNDGFIDGLEASLKRDLKKRKPDPKLRGLIK